MKNDIKLSKEMAEIIERLHEVIEKSGLSYSALSDKTGIAKSSLQRYATGQIKRIPIENIKKIAVACNVSARYIMGWDEEEDEGIVVLDDVKFYRTPQFLSVSAGFGARAGSEVVGYTMLPYKSKAEADESMAIKVEGNSMFPKIEEGDWVVVRKQSSVDSGTVAVVMIDGEEGVVKKVTYGDDWIVLHSFNPEYMDREFRGADVQRIRVLGKVTKVIKEM